MMHEFRPVTPADLDLICRHRHEMFKASGRRDEQLAAMSERFRPWLEPRLADGRYFGWIAEVKSIPVAGLGMMVIDWPPHPSHPDDDRRGYILNVFVEPDYRRAGVARELMDMAGAEARHRGLRFAVLHATAQGRPLYARLGWKQTSEMAMTID
jgi:ribosomal protein S18 acetylase RimI-like enzyme